MRKRFFLWLALAACVFLGVLWPQADARAAEADPAYSSIAVAQSTVDPYQSVRVTVHLKEASNTTVTTVPTGKVYIWATDASDNITANLDVVPLSLGENVYVHQTERRGVLIMDAASLIAPQHFNLNFSVMGTYELHALYMPTGAIDPDNISNYWPYELVGAGSDKRTVTVNPTPASDVAMMVASTKIRGIAIDSLLIAPPRNQTLTTPISVDHSGSAPTEVRLTLLRENGLSVGAEVPVYISSTAPSLNISNLLVKTNANGVATFNISGIIADGATLQLRCSLSDTPVTIPLTAYEYRPQKIRMTIGSTLMDVDGRTVEIDSPAVISGGRTYVPFRAIGELLGARVEYDNSVRTITMYFENSVLTMSIGYNHYAIDGTVYQMDAAPYINGEGRTMVPIRFIGEVLGYNVRAVSSGGLTSEVIFTRK